MNQASVLVVDDVAVFRTVITVALEHAGFQVVGAAATGAEALDLIQRLRPALMTLDLAMPGMGGLDVLRAMTRLPPDLRLPRVVVFSAHSADGAGATMEALRLGAGDFVLKQGGADGASAIAEHLIPALRALQTAAPTPPPRTAVATGRIPSPVPFALPLATQQRRIVAIAASTGGPPALELAFRHLPADLPVPIVITQHMPPVFTAVFAEHLQRVGRLRVVEAEDGMRLEPAVAYIAPGDWHLTVAEIEGAPRIVLNRSPAIFGLRPAADVMFASLARVFGGRVVAVIFTGMGCDGTAGAQTLKAAGAAVLTQTRETCVVYGMPAAADQAGLADAHFTPEGFTRALSGFNLRA